jgi:hypothetical protein
MAGAAPSQGVPAPVTAGSSEYAAITSRVHARIGLLGNPSDGYHGKTVSFALANFYAEVRCCVCVCVCWLSTRTGW